MKYGISRASWLGIRSDMSIHGVFVSVGQHYIKPVTVFVLVQIEHYEKFHRNVTSTRHDMVENIAHLHLLTLISKISQATKRLLKFEIGVCSWKLVKKKKKKKKKKSFYRRICTLVIYAFLGHSMTNFHNNEFCQYERKICNKHFICYSLFN